MRRQRGPDEQEKPGIREALTKAFSRRNSNVMNYDIGPGQVPPGDFMPPQAAADSIWAAMGVPNKPMGIAVSGADGGGHYLPGEDVINLTPNELVRRGLDKGYNSRQISEILAPAVLAHEATHAATLQDEGVNPDFDGFLRMFFGRFNELPLDQKLHHLEEYYGKGNTAGFRRRVAERSREPNWRGENANPYEVMDAYLTSEGHRGESRRELLEILGRTSERGFELARRADPNDPSKMREKVREADEEYPGTREAFNFWMRNFLQLDPDR